MKKFLRCAVLALPLLLTACEGGVQETLGLNREAPDEFTVVSRPPLTVPPEFTLRPPNPGEAPLGSSADEKARSLLTGTTTPAPASTAVTSNGAAASLLKRAGADAADADIRSKLGVDEKTPADTSKATTLMEQLSGAQKKEPTVDAAKEAERLRANKAAGKPMNAGDVPEVKPGSDSLIDKIF